MKARFFLFLLIFAGTFETATCQTTAKRYALVIGVQNYTSVAPLRHSQNDATDMSVTLKSKGFQVESLYNPKTKKEIRDALTRYYNVMNSTSGGVGIIYYAGHGIQFENENYLIPAAANIQVPGDVDDQCVKMNTMMSVLNSSDNLNMLFMDACRTNTFPAFSRDISQSQGLAAVQAPKGSIVVFATQPGTVASDGTGKNGLFTSKLLQYINEPNLSIRDVIDKVKNDVYEESGHKQLPSEVNNSLGGAFYFERVEKPAALTSSAPEKNNSYSTLHNVITNRKGSNYALIFASTNYNEWPQLANPILDAYAIEKTLVSKYAFKAEVVINATKQKMIDKLSEYQKKTYGSADQLMVYFSGNGKYDEIFKESYIVATDSKINDPSNQTTISQNYVKSLLSSIPCSHILLTIDGAASPTAVSSESKIRMTELDQINRIELKTRKYINSTGMRYAPEGQAGKLSPFAKQFVAALDSNGGNDSVLTLTELMAQINDLDSKPTWERFGNDVNESEFYFAAR